MKTITHIVWIGLALFIALITRDIYGQVQTMVQLTERRVLAEERCETSMHLYLDELVQDKAGVLATTTEKITVDSRYPAPLAPENYP